MKLRLLIYSHDWAPSVGGIQTVVMSLARGFAQWSQTHPDEEIKVTLVTRTPAGDMDDGKLPFRVIRRPSAYELFKLVRQADLIHSAGPALPPLVIGWLLRKPVVLEHSGYQSICPNGILVYGPSRSLCPGHFMAHRYLDCVRCNAGEMGWFGSMRSLLATFPRRWLCARVARNVAPSGHIAKRINLPREEIIYHGVPQVPLPNDRHLSSPPRFAYVGRLVAEKGVDTLLEASHKLLATGHAFRLTVIGDGPELNALLKMADDLGIRGSTDFAGSLPPARVSQTLTDVTAIVLPSACEDVAPLTAIEQMAQRNLIIASDIGGLGEIVDGEGLKFRAGDADALASRMRQALDEPELAESLRQRASARALQFFSEERMLKEHVRVYRELVHKTETTK